MSGRRYTLRWRVGSLPHSEARFEDVDGLDSTLDRAICDAIELSRYVKADLYTYPTTDDLCCCNSLLDIHGLLRCSGTMTVNVWPPSSRGSACNVGPAPAAVTNNLTRRIFQICATQGFDPRRCAMLWLSMC
jgi:hypothetical protein